MNHFRPHLSPRPTFEGYYSKFDLPSGAHIALVICSVPNSSTRPHMVSFTYVPSKFPETPHFQREIWVEDIQMLDQPSSSSLPTSDGDISNQDDNTTPISFHLHIPDVGSMTVYADNSTTYDIVDPKGTFTFSANVPGDSGTETRTPWSRSSPNSTPEGLLIHLPLPLHWHVHTLSSPCPFNLTISSSSYEHLDPSDSPASSSKPNLPLAHVHQEKNWAHSFPTSHIWVQAHKPQTRSGIALAGGSIIGTQSYLLTYHGVNPDHDVSFTPPYSMTLSLVPSVSPTLSVTSRWTNNEHEECSFDLTATSLTRKIEVNARAARSGFFGLSAPFDNGHRLNYLGQSFGALVRVRVWGATRVGLGHWELLCEEMFDGASLEFGGDEYGAMDKGRRESADGTEK